MDLSTLSLKELHSLQEQIMQEIGQREKEEIAKAREQILAIAHSVGIPLKDFLDNPKATKSVVVKNKVAIRYRHPSEQSLQWTGRGRKPNWVNEWIKSGKSLDSLLIGNQ